MSLILQVMDLDSIVDTFHSIHFSFQKVPNFFHPAASFSHSKLDVEDYVDEDLKVPSVTFFDIFANDDVKKIIESKGASSCLSTSYEKLSEIVLKKS